MPHQRARAQPEVPSGGRPLAVGLLLFVPISLAGSALGSALRYPDVGAAVLFVPYAALTAALLVARRRDWIWYIAAATLTHLATSWPDWPLSWVLTAAAANAARALTAAVLLASMLGRRPRLDSVRAVSLFLLGAVVVAPAVGATIGAANVMLHGAADSYWDPWRAWFVSNALTGLTMLPAFMAAFAHAVGVSRWALQRRDVVEALVVAVALGVTSAAALLADPGLPRVTLSLYAPLPVLIWAALRFGAAGVSLTLTVVTVALIWSADRGTGPFMTPLHDDNIVALQVFVLCTALPLLYLAAISTARQQVVRLHNALLASLHDQWAILDADGVVLEVNESWRQFAETAAVQPFDRVRPGDHYLAACHSAAARGDATAAGVLAGVTSVLNRTRRRFEIEYDGRHGGRWEAHVMSVEALERPDGGAVVTRADVTASREAQMEIETQRRELSHLSRVAVLGQLSAAIAHELNQPLAAILSNAEAAQQVLRRHPDDREYLAAILQDIVADDRRAAAVIRRLRALLKPGDRRFQLVDMEELMTDVVGLAHTELVARQIEAAAVVAPSLPPLWGDRVQLQQVLLNFILNGCEAMATTAAPRRRLVLMAEADGPATVHIAIRDHGTGIAPDLIDRLFEPFVTTKPDGLGLGLSISRTIVAAHGGRLWGENNPDGGATIHCVLPVGDPSYAATESARTAGIVAG